MILFRWVHTLLLYTITLVDTLVCSILAIIGGVFNPYSAFNNGVIRIWARIILWVSGVRVEVRGLENLDRDAVYIFTANHKSAYDILAMVAAIPGTARFIAKKELFRIPVFSRGMKMSGMLPIDRGNSAEARRTLDQAVQSIRDGCSVIIFPEGTRSKDDTIRPFKKGGFVLALKGHIPIVPTVIEGSGYVFPDNSHVVRPGVIRVTFLPPVDTTDKTPEDRHTLIRDVREQIVSHFDATFNRP